MAAYTSQQFHWPQTYSVKYRSSYCLEKTVDTIKFTLTRHQSNLARYAGYNEVIK